MSELLSEFLRTGWGGSRPSPRDGPGAAIVAGIIGALVAAALTGPFILSCRDGGPASVERVASRGDACDCSRGRRSILHWLAAPAAPTR